MKKFKRWFLATTLASMMCGVLMSGCSSTRAQQKEEWSQRRQFVGFFQYKSSPILPANQTNLRIGTPDAVGNYEDSKVFYIENKNYNRNLAIHDFIVNFPQNVQNEMKQRGFISVVVSNGKDHWDFPMNP